MSVPVSPDLGQSRLNILDGLRATAVLLVIARHSMKAFWRTSTHVLPHVAFILNGWSGVELFFVLSGFLIARQLLAGDTILHFYKKRFLRIAPAYYVFLTLGCLGLFPAYPMSDRAHVFWWRYIYHLLFLQDVFPNDIDYIYWSLAVEFQFYILSPFLVAGLLLVQRRKRYALFALAAAGSLSIKAWAALHWFPTGVDYMTYEQTMYMRFPFQLDGFIAGMLASFLWQDEDTRRNFGRPVVANLLFWSGASLFTALMVFSIPVDVHVGLFAEVFLIPLLAIAFGAMLLGLLGGCSGHRMFSTRSLRFVGLISYSMYLIHGSVLVPIVKAALTVIPESHPVLAWLLSLGPILFFCICLSTLSYFIVEEPCIAWSKKR